MKAKGLNMKSKGNKKNLNYIKLKAQHNKIHGVHLKQLLFSP